MNRLTERLPNGVLRPRIVSGDSVMHRLAAYEDTGLLPEEVAEQETAVSLLTSDRDYERERADRYCAENVRLRAELESAKCDMQACVLDAAPTIDPERYAWWIEQGVNEDGNVDCNCSGCGAGDAHMKGLHVPYCWKCGAKMDEVVP